MLVCYKSKVLPTDWNKQSIVNCFRLFLLYKMLNYIIHYTKLLLVPLYFQRKHLMLRFYPLFDCLVLCVINLKIFPIMIDDFVIEWKFYFSLPSTRIYILFSNMTNSHFESFSIGLQLITDDNYFSQHIIWYLKQNIIGSSRNKHNSNLIPKTQLNHTSLTCNINHRSTTIVFWQCSVALTQTLMMFWNKEQLYAHNCCRESF